MELLLEHCLFLVSRIFNEMQALTGAHWSKRPILPTDTEHSLSARHLVDPEAPKTSKRWFRHLRSFKSSRGVVQEGAKRIMFKKSL